MMPALVRGVGRVLAGIWGAFMLALVAAMLLWNGWLVWVSLTHAVGCALLALSGSPCPA